MQIRAVSAALLVLLFGAGCSSAPAWGAGATPCPSSQRIHRALVGAARDPHTWMPAIGAAVFGLTPLDEEVSDWATSKTPLFGSGQNASDMSSVFRDATRAGAGMTFLIVPSGDTVREIAVNKAKGFAVQAAALWLPGQMTILTKDWVGRERPDGSSRQSFPSGHASGAASFAAIGRRNLEWIGMPSTDRRLLDGGFTALVALTAWGRVEGEKHFPSDVLAGIALGNFVTLFVNDAFLGRACACPVSVVPGPDGVACCVGFDL